MLRLLAVAGACYLAYRAGQQSGGSGSKFGSESGSGGMGGTTQNTRSDT